MLSKNNCLKSDEDQKDETSIEKEQYMVERSTSDFETRLIERAIKWDER